VGGSAILGTNLVDRLVPMTDRLRGRLNAMAGVRQYAVYRVLRTWSGGRRGEGTATTLLREELTPAPKVDFSRLRNHLEPAGLLEDGGALLTEVSLTYTEAELTGRPLAADEEFFFELVDVQGQASRTRYFEPTDAPLVVDRERDIGWRVPLRRFEPQGGVADVSTVSTP
jgi:hypothetical protein